MRIDGTTRTSGGYRAGTVRNAGGASFSPEQGVSTPDAAGLAPVVAAGSLDALLALQAVEDPLHAKRKALKRGHALLDTLDEVKADLLLGRVGEGRLNQMVALIGQAREQTLPGLDSVLDDIELRVRVELAKFERFAVA